MVSQCAATRAVLRPVTALLNVLLSSAFSLVKKTPLYPLGVYILTGTCLCFIGFCVGGCLVAFPRVFGKPSRELNPLQNTVLGLLFSLCYLFRFYLKYFGSSEAFTWRKQSVRRICTKNESAMFKIKCVTGKGVEARPKCALHVAHGFLYLYEFRIIRIPVTAFVLTCTTF